MVCVQEKPIDSNQTALAQNKDCTPPGQAGLPTRADLVAIRTSATTGSFADTCPRPDTTLDLVDTVVLANSDLW